MKQTRNTLIGIVAATAWLLAGSVGTLTTFTANTTAKASEVNGNFNAVKTAVNGNANDTAANKSDISDNANDIATNKADIAINTADIAGAITDIDATGGLTGGGSSGNVTIRRASGSVAIPPAAFHPSTDPSKCFLETSVWSTFFIKGTTTDNDCNAVAPVTLPDGATLKKLTCVVKDDDSQGHPYIYLYRSETRTGTSNYVLAVRTEANSSSKQIIYSDNVMNGYSVVNNSQYTYFLYYDPPNNTSNAGIDQALFGCIIDYSY